MKTKNIILVPFALIVFSCNHYDVQTYIKQAKDFAAKGDYKKAIIDFTSAIRIDKNNADAYFYRADAYFQLQRLDSAITDFSSVIKINPKYQYAYTRRGFIYYKIGKLNLSIDDYSSEIKKFPNEFEAY